jgi:cytidine deaminase
MRQISNEELIEKAKSVVKPRKIKHGFTVGDVGCALITDKGNVYLGVCIDTASGMGFCAEHSAIAAMVTHGEHIIKKIVAVVENGKPIPHVVDAGNSCIRFMKTILKQKSSLVRISRLSSETCFHLLGMLKARSVGRIM